MPNRQINEPNNKITSKSRLQKNQEKIFQKIEEWYGCICFCYIRIETTNIYKKPLLQIEKRRVFSERGREGITKAAHDVFCGLVFLGGFELGFRFLLLN